jgi:thioredoxin 1
MPTKPVTDASFQSDVLDADRPVLVDFWADWCGPCKMIAPALEEISDELADEVTVTKMDIVDNPETPGRLGVRGIPYLALYKDGERVAEMTGARPKGDLKRWLEGELERTTG